MLNIRPLRGHLYIQLDPQPKMIGSIHVPDKDFVKICGKCGLVAEALDGPCIPEDVFELEKRRDVLHFRGQDTSHDIQYVERNIVTSETVVATVLRSGSGVNFVPGERLLVKRSVGRSLDPDNANSNFRDISLDAVLAEVEEEEE